MLVLVNSLGRGLSTSKSTILSVNFIKYNNKILVICSGDGQKLDLFWFDDFYANKLTGEFVNWFIYVVAYNANTFFRAEEERKWLE